ncbi:MAG: hypothetical protein MJY65_00140 [Bacteroidaceae bacterium]|nr:hypothetical protein [Bacteroidaceae bacterium]
MKNRLILSMTVLLTCMYLSCSSEDYVPPIITDFVTAYTDHAGHICAIADDRGNRYVTEDTVTMRPDTLYRQIMQYIANSDGYAEIKSRSNVLTIVPKRRIDKETESDPIFIRSLWVGGGWLNMILEIKAMNKRHRLDVIDESTDSTVVFSIFHDENGDIRSNTGKAYISVPLGRYKEILSGCDRISVSYVNYDGNITEMTVRAE